MLIAPAISPEYPLVEHGPFGHAGHHMAYLNPRWQAAKLLPALDPSLDSAALRARWTRTCEER